MHGERRDRFPPKPKQGPFGGNQESKKWAANGLRGGSGIYAVGERGGYWRQSGGYPPADALLGAGVGTGIKIGIITVTNKPH